MTHFARPLFALFVLGLVATALVLSALGWVDSHPSWNVPSIDTTQLIDAAESATGPLELAEN